MPPRRNPAMEVLHVFFNTKSKTQEPTQTNLSEIQETVRGVVQKNAWAGVNQCHANHGAVDCARARDIDCINIRSMFEIIYFCGENNNAKTLS